MTILAIVVAFLLGSIPWGYLIGWLVYRKDIRRHGSGNIGAANALRALGKGGGAAVLLLDALKGYVAVFLTLWLGLGDAVAAGAAAAAVLGHCFSPWLRFKGGKGVATSFGAVFALSWPAGIAAVLGWVAGTLATQYSSVGSLFGSLLAPLAIYAFSVSLAETLYGVFAFFLIVFTHRDNIARLRDGTENPIGFS